MNEIEYKLVKLGKLKYDRVKSMSILKKEINSFGYCYSLTEIKELFDAIQKEGFDESFNRKFKSCFNMIFINNEYQEICDNEMFIGNIFPENQIPPYGGVGGYIIE